MPGTERGGKAPSGAPLQQSEVRRTQIGPYQLITKIGEGGMGTVWLTKLPGPAGFNKIAVVKELRADLAGSPAFVEMFLNEARLAARLTHPNVVHTYGANDDGGRLYIAMEYLDGQPWSRVRNVLWANRSLPLAVHIKVLADALAGLHYAHELRDYDGTPLQVVHRDMSPQNVFVTYDGQVKVVDFGVARAVNSQQQDSGVFVGKLAYSAPEQLRGGPLDRRADVFAVGVMLWEALAGRRLMEEQQRSIAFRRRASEPAPAIRTVAPNVPRALADICDRALALKPEDRFATAAEFRDALLAYQAESSQVADAAELGALVANAFRDERQTIQSLIERHLMHPTKPPPPGTPQELIDTLRPPPPADHHTIRADLSELASVSTLEDEDAMIDASSSLSLRVEAARRRKLWMGGAGAGLLLAGLSIWLLMRGEAAPESVVVSPLPRQGSAEGAGPSAGASASAERAAELANREVALDIRAQPPNATIYIDGQPLPSNPYRGRVPAGDELHLVRVTAPGMLQQERVIAFDRDRTLEFELLPARTAETARSRRPRSRTDAERVPRAADREPSGAAPSAELGAPPTTAKTAQPGQPAADPEPDFDSRITPDTAPRPIYEEDPYR